MKEAVFYKTFTIRIYQLTVLMIAINFCANQMYGVGGVGKNVFFTKFKMAEKFFQVDFSSPNSNFVEHTCLHICAKFQVNWSYGVCYVA